nr:hypothetical protein [uncultured archaeon]
MRASAIAQFSSDSKVLATSPFFPPVSQTRASGHFPRSRGTSRHAQRKNMKAKIEHKKKEREAQPW